MVQWNCDICGKATMVNPPTEFEKDELGVHKTTTMRQQNIYTNEVEEIKTYQLKDLFPRAYIVKLNLGNESVQRDFCAECLETIYPKLNEVFELLSSI